MVLYIVQRGGEQGLRTALRTAQTTPAASLWESLFPDARYKVLVEALAQKLFNAPLGAELDQALRGPICCIGLRNLADIACHASAPHGADNAWLDQTTVPRGACRLKW
jgi:hypothetical protein